MSHLLDMTGAPIVLVSAVPVLRSMGYEVVVLGPEDGGSMPLFLEAGATVITRKGCVQSPLLWGLALCADLVLANTVVEARAVRALSGARVPVLWWLHDAFAGYPHIAHQIPRELGENIRLYSVGSHAANAMHSVRPEFNIRPLIYGLPDYAAEKFSHYDLSYAGGRPLFATVGSFENRKGQDIFCKAIRLLPPETMKKASFLFVGKAAEAEMMDAVRSLTADCPDNVFYVKRLTRDEIKSLMAQCTCLVCASRDDPCLLSSPRASSSASPPSCRSTPAPPGSSPRAWTVSSTRTTTPKSWPSGWPGPSSTRKSWPPCVPPAVSFTRAITPSRRSPTVYNRL